MTLLIKRDVLPENEAKFYIAEIVNHKLCSPIYLTCTYAALCTWHLPMPQFYRPCTYDPLFTWYLCYNINICLTIVKIIKIENKALFGWAAFDLCFSERLLRCEKLELFLIFRTAQPSTTATLVKHNLPESSFKNKKPWFAQFFKGPCLT